RDHPRREAPPRERRARRDDRDREEVRPVEERLRPAALGALDAISAARVGGALERERVPRAPALDEAARARGAVERRAERVGAVEVTDARRFEEAPREDAAY